MIDTLVTLAAFGLLLALLFFVILVTVSAFFHLRQMVVYVPTPQVVTDAMIELGNPIAGELVLDLGAGDGRILARLMEKVPGVQTIGYEGALGVWLLAKIRGLFSRNKPPVHLKNFLKVDLSKANIIFTYLSVSMMATLLPKFQRELQKGTRVVSHAFTLPGLRPDKTIDVTMPFFGKTTVYLYVWPPMTNL